VKAELLLAEQEAKSRPAKAAGGKAAAAPAVPSASPDAPAEPDDAPPAHADASGKPGVAAKGQEPGAEKKPAGRTSGGAVIYAGEYVGSDTSSYDLGGVKREDKDDKAKTRVDGAGPEVAVTFVDSGNGKDICTLKARMKGKSGTFAAGQKCWANDAGGMSGKLTAGSLTFDDKKLVIDADFDIEIGGGEQQLSGSLHYHFEGTRK
jgi:hypothetical protein